MPGIATERTGKKRKIVKRMDEVTANREHILHHNLCGPQVRIYVYIWGDTGALQRNKKINNGKVRCLSGTYHE